jgi:hypothetical protein
MDAQSDALVTAWYRWCERQVDEADTERDIERFLTWARVVLSDYNEVES